MSQGEDRDRNRQDEDEAVQGGCGQGEKGESKDEAKAHEHNIAREAFIDIDGFVQPAPSPRFSHDKVHIKHNSKEIGSDNLEICSRFGLDPDCFS